MSSSAIVNPVEVAAPVDSDVVIRVENLSKCYQIYDKPQHRLYQGLLRGRKQFFREFWALKDVSFQVRRGETVGIIGRNGSGKSTLLQMICGTLTPTSGTIDVRGRVGALLELGAGFNPEFTGRENVYMNGAVLGLSRNQIDARFADMVDFADIGDFLDQPVKTYSTGMFVRLAFSVIAHSDADVLIVDEALSVGDAFFVQKCMRFLRRFQHSGSILFVSHDIGSVVNLCGRAIWLEGGEVSMQGSPKDVTEAYLESYYEPKRKSGKVLQSSRVATNSKSQRRAVDEARDSPLRRACDIGVFTFQPDSASFGLRGALIRDVRFLDETGRPVLSIVGGEAVTLCVTCECLVAINSPIIGFLVKDRLGQVLFSENTFLAYRDHGFHFEAGAVIEARFRFVMPILAAGHYSITAAIAEGTEIEHIQHHWIHDAIVFEAHTSTVCVGIVGVPMQEILLKEISVRSQGSSS